MDFPFFRGVPDLATPGWAEFEKACRRRQLCEPPEEVATCCNGTVTGSNGRDDIPRCGTDMKSRS